MRLGVGLVAVAVLATAGCDVTEADAWSDWTVTVYYTPVESYHDGPRETVHGCSDLACTDSDAELGTLPTDFIEAVRDEGTGRITSGEHAGAYLNWSYDTGFWLDSQPRDAAGEVLRPFQSAAADDLTPGLRLRLTDCGVLNTADPDTCAKFQAVEWSIAEGFAPSLGGARHLDLYIGEETSENFTESPDYVFFLGATLAPLS
ncbi:hypothetical protein [Nocardia sp. NPDC049149]|uniref:hypothetical protein n=1 Tax=Nocardia sp. NPDC049149 TaxID=3364315 RepID=UPI00371F0A1C